MSFAASLLVIGMQVGPNPTPLELEPLPMSKAEKDRLAGTATAASAPSPATATGRTIAGNMAIIEGEYESALALLGEAQQLALAEGKPRMAAEIGLDRARALMMLGRHSEADQTLETARLQLPGHADAWVMSAVNARRMGNLEQAQSLIQQAAGFAPHNPGVDLEAGTLAYVVGDIAAAMASWQSVIDAEPASHEAEIARQYIDAAEEEQNPTGLITGEVDASP